MARITFIPSIRSKPSILTLFQFFYLRSPILVPENHVGLTR